MLVGVAGLLLIVHSAGKAMLRCAGFGLVWLTVDVLLDRIDAGLPLTIAAAVLLGLGFGLSTRRQSTVEIRGRRFLLTYCMLLLAFVAGAAVIASAASGSFKMPTALVTGRLYAGGTVTGLAALMAGAMALEISGRLTRTRYLVAAAAAAVLAFAFTALPFSLDNGANLVFWSLAASVLVIAACLTTARLVGTIQTGHYADLVLLSKNPLNDIDNLDSVEWVMVGGKLWRPGQLRSGIAMK